jgi:integrase
MVWFLENPVQLVEVLGVSKRSRKPAVLTFEQFWLIFGLLKEPYNIMSLVEQCAGLGVSELLALRWTAVDFDRLCMKIEEGVVHGRIGQVKTEYSNDELPLDPDVATSLLEWKRKSKGTGLILPSPITGYSYDASPIQQDWIRRAGWCLVACSECGAVPGVACTVEHRGRGKKFNIPVHDCRRELATENGFGSVGWHTFRHTYRTFLGELKAPLEVPKALTRQADISTTLKYGQSSMENQSRANTMVVREILIRRSQK